MKKQYRVMAVLFLVILMGIAIISDYKVMNYYINNETDYNEWKAESGGKFETDYISNFFEKYQYVNLNGLMRRILQQHEMNGVIKMNNGFLMTAFNKQPEEKLDGYAENVAAFSRYVTDKGIEYLYITVPYVVDKYDPQLPDGEQDYGNENLDYLQKALTDRGVETLDLREAIHDSGLETYDIFYRTDHHWSTRGGYWAFSQIVNCLEQKQAIEAQGDCFDLNNYDIVTYPKWHLGSRGQRTGIYFGGIDDYDLITPKFETRLENLDTQESGTFQEIVVNMEPLANRVYTSRYTYDYVMGKACANYHNPDAPIDKTVVIIGDSMSTAVCPFNILAFKNALFLETESVADIDEAYLEKYKPDIIISMYYATNMENDRGYDFRLGE